MVHFKAFFVYCGNCEGYPFAHGCIHFKSAYMKQLEFGTVFYKLVFVQKQNCSVYLRKVLNSHQLETGVKLHFGKCTFVHEIERVMIQE